MPPRTKNPHQIDNSPNALAAFSKALQENGDRRAEQLRELGRELLNERKIILRENPPPDSTLHQLIVLSKDEKSIETWILGSGGMAQTFQPLSSVEIEYTEDLIRRARALQST